MDIMARNPTTLCSDSPCTSAFLRRVLYLSDIQHSCSPDFVLDVTAAVTIKPIWMWNRHCHINILLPQLAPFCTVQFNCQSVVTPHVTSSITHYLS
jgi:hypothetical protein